MAKKILITGGTGLIGKELRELLRLQGHDVSILSRSKKEHPHFRFFQWDVEKDYIEEGALNVDCIIHLAGAGIAEKPWTNDRKKIIIDSRVKTTALLGKKLREMDGEKPGYIGASAIGIYGNQDSRPFNEDEESTNRDNFLVEICHQWEEAHEQLNKVVGQWAVIRIGIVMSPEGGALNKLLIPMKGRVANYFGDGSQIFSWIHIGEICRMFSYMVENEISGIYNGVAPNPVNGKELANALASVKSGPYLKFGVPETALRLMFGEMADAVLASSWVSSDKIEKSGFHFEFEKIDKALKDLIA